LRDVVIVFAVFGAGLRIEEVVASDEFEDLKKSVYMPSKSELYTHHSCHAPNVSTSTPFRAQYDFW
jgi:hypothetical protein